MFENRHLALFRVNRPRLALLPVFLSVIILVVSCNKQPIDGDNNHSAENPQIDKVPRLEQLRFTGHRRRSTITSPRASLSVETLSVSASACTPLKGSTIYRFINGHDNCPIEMTQTKIAAELNDPWAVSVLRNGTFPDSVTNIVSAINSADPTLQQNSYMVGEGSQIPPTLIGSDGNPIGREVSRQLRYAITWNPNEQPINLLLSAVPGGHSSFLQIISWDASKNQFNFYDFGTADAGGEPTWTWAGDSSWARNPQSIGKGCFDCHHNGVTIMKEFNVPWNNWNSALATIQPSFVPQAVSSEPLFQQRQNAPNFQNAIQGAVQRYYNFWLRSFLTQNKTAIENVPEILRHLIVNTTVQLDSTLIRSNPSQTSPPNSPITGLPKDFFLWDSVLRNVLDLNYQIPNSLQFDHTAYDDYLKDKAFALEHVSANGDVVYQQAGSTNFAFFVPVPPQEDMFMIQMMLTAKVVSEKFVAAVLMVDFQNPVFSPTRQSLQQYANKITNGNLDALDIPNRFAAEVSAVAAHQPSCDPSMLDICTSEQQFLHYWNLADTQWKTEVESRIADYMNGIAEQVTDGVALDAYMSLSVSRRYQFATTPVISNLCEMPLLLPRTNILATTKPLRMSTDGTVAAGTKPTSTSPATCLAK